MHAGKDMKLNWLIERHQLIAEATNLEIHQCNFPLTSVIAKQVDLLCVGEKRMDIVLIDDIEIYQEYFPEWSQFRELISKAIRIATNSKFRWCVSTPVYQFIIWHHSCWLVLFQYKIPSTTNMEIPIRIVFVYFFRMYCMCESFWSFECQSNKSTWISLGWRVDMEGGLIMNMRMKINFKLEVKWHI